MAVTQVIAEPVHDAHGGQHTGMPRSRKEPEIFWAFHLGLSVV
jgi:hypothetical protein